jgi:hypothetical protein
MSKDDIKEVLIAGICMWLLLFLISGCSSIDVVHQPGKMPKLDFKNETLDKICTKDFDADIKADSFVISCDIAL